MVSEDLLDIRLIYQDREGRESSEMHGTSPGGTKGGDINDYDQSGNRVMAELERDTPAKQMYSD